jgi:hypothetical protein
MQTIYSLQNGGESKKSDSTPSMPMYLPYFTSKADFFYTYSI